MSRSPRVSAGGILLSLQIAAMVLSAASPAGAQPMSATARTVPQASCTTIDGNLNLTIPCVDVGGAQYQVVLNYSSDPAAPGTLFWQLGPIQAGEDNGFCASIDGALNLTLPCVDVAGSQYRVSLLYAGMQNTTSSHFWTLGNIAPADGGQVDIPWLREGNFWKVAWSEIETNVSWTEAGGTYDLGSYNIKLGSPLVAGGMQMFELILSGDTRKYAPLWKRIGTDNQGNIYGMTSDIDAPVRIYSVADDAWSGHGFYTVFQVNKPVTVNRNAQIIPSQYTKGSVYFEGPLTSVGWSTSDQQIYSGTGCDYFPGYGTICGGGPSSGPSRNEMQFEYWDDQAGPVAMHYAYNYEDCLGTFCNEKHVEQRAEVWFFGNTADSAFDFSYEDEPDTYADPTPLPVSETLFTMFAEVNNFDIPSGYLPGYDAPVGMDLASRIHDWYSFEVLPADADKTIDFYLFWNDPVELDFYLYTAPDNDVYGFLYLAEGEPSAIIDEFEHTKFFSGTYLPGKYLLGVIRTTDTEFATGYGIMSFRGVVE